MNQLVQNKGGHKAGASSRTTPAAARAAKPGAATAAPPPGRTNDPERTMAEILTVARQEFSEKGLAGARIDEIAAATRTSKRMIYYYFGSKEGLYLRVIEEAYRRVRAHEATYQLDDLPPEDALRRLVGGTFDHHHANQDYIRLVMNENIQRGAFIRQSKVLRQLNAPAIEEIRRLYARGLEQGIFRAGLDPVDIHATISALAFFNVANQHTFGSMFNFDTQQGQGLLTRRDNIIETVVRYVRK